VQYVTDISSQKALRTVGSQGFFMQKTKPPASTGGFVDI
jgi:hypothetical protein